jgi:tetratricopeptide (TPR) repeat protein
VKALHALELGQHELAHGIVHEVECRADDISESRDLLVVVHFKVGDAALARGDTAEAIEHLEKALQYEPNHEVIKETLVIARSDGTRRPDAKIQAQLTEALKAAARKGIALTPESVDQLLRLLNGQTDGAVAIELVELVEEIKREKKELG